MTPRGPHSDLGSRHSLDPDSGPTPDTDMAEHPQELPPEPTSPRRPIPGSGSWRSHDQDNSKTRERSDRSTSLDTSPTPLHAPRARTRHDRSPAPSPSAPTDPSEPPMSDRNAHNVTMTGQPAPETGIYGNSSVPSRYVTPFGTPSLAGNVASLSTPKKRKERSPPRGPPHKRSRSDMKFTEASQGTSSPIDRMAVVPEEQDSSREHSDSPELNERDKLEGFNRAKVEAELAGDTENIGNNSKERLLARSLRFAVELRNRKIKPRWFPVLSERHLNSNVSGYISSAASLANELDRDRGRDLSEPRIAGGGDDDPGEGPSDGRRAEDLKRANEH